jgi:hypothetical protein
MTIRFLDPRSVPLVGIGGTHGVGALTDKYVALIDNSKANAGFVLSTVGGALTDVFGARTVAYKKRVASEPMDADALDQMAARCDLVVTAIGD